MEDFETEGTLFPICPYCGMQNMPEFACGEITEAMDGYVEVVSCKKCERGFEALMNIEVTFETYRLE